MDSGKSDLERHRSREFLLFCLRNKSPKSLLFVFFHRVECCLWIAVYGSYEHLISMTYVKKVYARHLFEKWYYGLWRPIYRKLLLVKMNMTT